MILTRTLQGFVERGEKVSVEKETTPKYEAPADVATPSPRPADPSDAAKDSKKNALIEELADLLHSMQGLVSFVWKE